MNATVSPVTSTPRLQPLRVSINATASLAGNIIHVACQAALLIALTRLGEPAMVGQFAMGLAISGPIMLLASLQLRSVQVTDAGGRNHFSEYLALRLVTSGIALGVIAVAALVFSRTAAAAGIIILVGLTKNVEAVTDVYRGLMQRAERMERVAVSMILRGVVAVPVFTLTLWLSTSLIVALAALTAADVMVWWLWDVRNARLLAGTAQPGWQSAWLGLPPRFDRPTLIRLARTALPLGLVAMLLSLNSYAPQFAIKHYISEAELGIFAAILFAAMATRLFIGAVGQSASPRLAHLYDAGDRAGFRKLHRQMLGFGAAIGVAAILAAILIGEPVLRLVYGAAYAARASLFIELSIVSAVIHLVSLQGYTVTAARSFRAQFPVSILVATTTLTTALIAVPHFGVRGAALAMLAGATVQGAGYSYLLRRALHRLTKRTSTVEHAHAVA